MNITIIGSGNVGSALAVQLSQRHSVKFGVRDVQNFKGKELVQQLNVAAVPLQDASTDAEVIIVATPPQFVPAIVAELGDLSGKIVVDATNSFRSKPDGYANGFEALKLLATGAEVVKCFNSTGAENMINPDYGAEQADMFMAGDSEKGKQVVEQLCRDIGFANCYDFGDDDKVQLLEYFAQCWINLAIFQGNGRNMALKVLKR